jgi:hypothetical protein
MPTNNYFNFFPGDSITTEQLLVEDLVIEAMKIHGMDVYYLPRSTRDNETEDFLYGEDTTKQYREAYVIEMYLENTSAMEGEGDFISKFGLEIRDETSLLVSRRRFKMTVPNIGRPREGDLIYIPLLQNFFEITHVEHENNQAMMYTLGKGRGGNVYVYALRMKQFVFSDEIISTGVEEIDSQILGAYRGTDLIMTVGGSGVFDSANNESIYQGSSFATATARAVVRDWSSSTRTLDAIRVQGTFLGNVAVKGVISNSSWTLATIDTDTPMTNAFEDLIDNKRIETEADAIIDFSDSNPFSEGTL